MVSGTDYCHSQKWIDLWTHGRISVKGTECFGAVRDEFVRRFDVFGFVGIEWKVLLKDYWSGLNFAQSRPFQEDTISEQRIDSERNLTIPEFIWSLVNEWFLYFDSADDGYISIHSFTMWLVVAVKQSITFFLRRTKREEKEETGSVSCLVFVDSRFLAPHAHSSSR